MFTYALNCVTMIIHIYMCVCVYIMSDNVYMTVHMQLCDFTLLAITQLRNILSRVTPSVFYASGHFHNCCAWSRL